MIPLMLAVAAVPSFDTSLPIDLIVGSGPTVEDGDRYSIAFRVEGASSRDYANTSTRGLSYTKELGDGHDGYFDAWVSGMSVGSLRRVVVAGGQAWKMNGMLPTHSSLVVTIKLLAVRKKARQ
jgi:hypothetical protein